MKKILIGALLLTGCALPVMACTGISATAKDGGYVQARTIEWGDSYLPSQYVVIPCGHEMISYTPKGMNGAKFRARYGVVGLSIVLKDFVVEGLNEAGLAQTEIASKLGVPGFVVRNITTCARAYTISELEQAVKDFVDAEESVKTGRLEDKLSVELLIIKYSSKVK